jgi:hypothetical protein
LDTSQLTVDDDPRNRTVRSCPAVTRMYRMQATAINRNVVVTSCSIR